MLSYSFPLTLRLEQADKLRVSETAKVSDVLEDSLVTTVDYRLRRWDNSMLSDLLPLTLRLGLRDKLRVSEIAKVCDLKGDEAHLQVYKV